MSANELALKFSTAPTEMLIGVLPVDEIAEVIHDRVRDEVEGEIDIEHSFQMQALEEELDNWTAKAHEFEAYAGAFAGAIKKALLADSWDEAKVLLERARYDHKEYF